MSSSAHIMDCLRSDYGTYDTTIKLNGLSYITDTVLPKDFPEIKLHGYSAFEARGYKCYPIDRKIYNVPIVASIIEGIKNDSTIRRTIKFPLGIYNDPVAFYLPECGVHVGDCIKFSQYDMVVTQIQYNLATNIAPATVEIILKDKATGKRLHVTRGLYHVIRSSGLAKMTLFE